MDENDSTMYWAIKQYEETDECIQAVEIDPEEFADNGSDYLPNLLEELATWKATAGVAASAQLRRMSGGVERIRDAVAQAGIILPEEFGKVIDAISDLRSLL